MAVATGTTDPTVIYQALVVDRYTDASWSEFIRARSWADDGRDPAGSEGRR